jgi:hypothetical protein
MHRRVSLKTWRLWSDGIKDNLGRGRAGFDEAWRYVPASAAASVMN